VSGAELVLFCAVWRAGKTDEVKACGKAMCFDGKAAAILRL
jgi:hypothetical protein